MSVINVQRPGSLPADRVICPDSMDRAFLAVAGRGRERDGWWRVPLLGRRGELPGHLRRAVLANEACAEALSAEAAADLDAEAVADWIVNQHRRFAYPAVVLGSPHGGALHLAAALGAAWLPTTFPVSVRWPRGSVADWAGAMAWGATVGAGIVARNPAVSVRQVHDPVRRGPLCARTISLRLAWRTLPAAYGEFLRTRLLPGGATLLLRDLRRWPVLGAAPEVGFQLGSPVGGWSPDDYREDVPAFRRLLDDLGVGHWSRPPLDVLARYAETAGDPALGTQLANLAASTGRPTFRVLYSTPEMLSACLADLFRAHLGGNPDCLVESGRLVDPEGTLTRGLVPYWCESASLRAVAGAEWWLAGSRGFGDISVLPEAPGVISEAHAGLLHWRSLAGFAGISGTVDRLAASRYPLLPLSTRHAARMVGEVGRPRAAPAPLTVEAVIAALRTNIAAHGLMIG